MNPEEHNGSNLWWLEFWRGRRNNDHLEHMREVYLAQPEEVIWSWSVRSV